MEKRSGYVVFGDLVKVKLSNSYKSGYLTSNRLRNAIVAPDEGDAMIFCTAPFGFFAEDEEMLGRSFNSAPIILQQLIWHPGVVIGGDRNMLIADDNASAGYQQMDITTQNDPRALIYFFDTKQPKRVNNPKYGEKYFMTLGYNQEFLTSQDSFVKLSKSPLEKGFNVQLEFAGSISNSSRNYPFSQAYAPYGDLAGKCNKCTKCTR